MASNLASRLKALETVGELESNDVRFASDAQLARFLSSTPVEALRADLATFPEADFGALVSAIRQHVPTYGGACGIS
jgi:hypothetical protein